MAAAIGAEWTKLRSVRGTWWSVCAVVGLTVLLTTFLCAVGQTDASQPGQGDDDVVVNSLRGVYLGQIAVAAFALSLITTEYATDVIRTTFAAMPRRGTVITAKTVVGSVVVLAAGLLASLASFLVGQPLLRASGFTEPAYPHVRLVDGPVLRAVVGAAVYLAVLAMLAHAVGVIVRRTAAATSAMLGLILVPLILVPLLPAAVGDWVARLAPTAGLAIMQTRTDLEAPIGPWAGLGVTCVWAVAALALALWLVRRRDA